MNEYNFEQKNKESRAESNEITKILLLVFPQTKIVETESGGEDDLAGIDYWVELTNGKKIGIDAKVREKDFGKDDVALETWSIINQKIGWTMDETHKTDFVLWYWKDTKQWCLFPFILLKAVFCEKKDEWAKRFRIEQQSSGEWQSECIFIPKKLIWAEIIKKTKTPEQTKPHIQQLLGGWLGCLFWL